MSFISSFFASGSVVLLFGLGFGRTVHLRGLAIKTRHPSCSRKRLIQGLWQPAPSAVTAPSKRSTSCPRKTRSSFGSHRGLWNPAQGGLGAWRNIAADAFVGACPVLLETSPAFRASCTSPAEGPVQVLPQPGPVLGQDALGRGLECKAALRPDAAYVLTL
jgi:hypothetical protein